MSSSILLMYSVFLPIRPLTICIGECFSMHYTACVQRMTRYQEGKMKKFNAIFHNHCFQLYMYIVHPGYMFLLLASPASSWSMESAKYQNKIYQHSSDKRTVRKVLF